MMMENSNGKTACQSRARVTVASLEGAEPRGVQLEAGEFERLLQRAAEALKVRQQGSLPPRFTLPTQ